MLAIYKYAMATIKLLKVNANIVIMLIIPLVECLVRNMLQLVLSLQTDPKVVLLDLNPYDLQAVVPSSDGGFAKLNRSEMSTEDNTRNGHQKEKESVRDKNIKNVRKISMKLNNLQFTAFKSNVSTFGSSRCKV